MGRDFRKLQIWQLAYNLVLDIYPLLDSYPDEEKLNLVDQIRRCVTSLPLNIAEGAGSHSNKVFVQFLGFAYKSSKELDVLLLLSKDLGYLELDVYDFLRRKLEEFKARLFKFLVAVEKESETGKNRFHYFRKSAELVRTSGK